MDNRHRSTVMICCSVFQAEVTTLRANHWPEYPIYFENSLLHMNPDRMAPRLEALIETELNQQHRILLIYGDCCAKMTELENKQAVVRTRGHNCCELLLGRDEYRRLSHAGAFFLLPEWAHRWHQIFADKLGLNHDNAMSLMQDIHHNLVYLDTGVNPIPEAELRKCSQYCGLPYDVHKVSLTHLYEAIHEALLKLESSGDNV